MSDYKERSLAYNREIKAVLELILGELNNGQRKKLLKNPTLAALLKRYGIAVDE